MRLSVVGDSAELAAVLGEHAGWLAAQCCAVDVSRAPLAAPLGASTVELAGASVALALAPAAAA